MKEQFLKKYQPKEYKDFIFGNKYISLLKSLIEMDNLNILLIGDNGCGKTSLLYATINEYYKTKKIPHHNVMIINNVKEQGIHYYRNQVKTFCQTPSTIHNKKKIIILDDIDFIHKQSQQVFRNCIDKYSHKVNFIASCNNIQKVIDSIQSRCTMIKIKPLEKDKLKKILNNIIKKENLNVSEDAKEIILDICNGSIRLLVNYLEKFKLLNYDIDEENVINICTNISYKEFNDYTDAWYVDKNIEESVKIIFSISEKGYSVIDILGSYFTFIKLTKKLSEEQKYKIIKIISEYIVLFYTIHEKKIELAFFTNKLIKEII